MRLRFMKVILPHSNPRHVSATYVAIFRMMLRTRIPIQIQLQYVEITARSNRVCILALTAFKMFTQVEVDDYYVITFHS